MDKELGDRRENLIDRLDRLEHNESDIFKSFEEKGLERITYVTNKTINKIQDMSLSCQDELDKLEQDLEKIDKI